MNDECEVIRDLLPLYADEVCSENSRKLVETHISGCPECRNLMAKLLDNRIEQNLTDEKKDVIAYGEKRFRRRSTAVGSVISALFMIPILVCLIVNITSGSGLGWFLVVLAALGVAASLIIVPIMVPEDKLLWTFCAFCASLLLLLGVVALVYGGSWFWIASSAVLFGLSVIFLPFVIKAKPVKKLLGNANRLLVVLGIDGALFVNMMNMIRFDGKLNLSTILFTVAVVAGIAMVALEIIRKRGNEQ
ncbi:MAG: zf-HC2 domain-containing protein [Clostridia bacterium]|nr:zf-HC2 domain-containing protein [Clostridia bacterium]